MSKFKFLQNVRWDLLKKAGRPAALILGVAAAFGAAFHILVILAETGALEMIPPEVMSHGLAALLFLVVGRLAFSAARRPLIAVAGQAPPLAGEARLVDSRALGSSEKYAPAAVEGDPQRIVPERTRWHEAGHAAVALRVGFTIAKIDTRPQGTVGGFVDLRGHPLGDHANESAWRKAIVCGAGVASERLFMGGDASALGASTDVREAQNLCTALAAAGFEVDGKTTSSDLLGEALRLAENYVREHEAEIRSLVVELEKEPVVAGARAAEIFENARESDDE